MGLCLLLRRRPACAHTGLCSSAVSHEHSLIECIPWGNNTDWEKVESIATHVGLEGFKSVQSVSFSHGFARSYIFRVQNTSTGK